MKELATLNGVPLAVSYEYATALQAIAKAAPPDASLDDPAIVAQLAPHAGARSATGGTQGGIGVIGINGFIGPKSAYPDTAVERVASEFAALLADDKVSTIVLHVDSPGGIVHGTPELAAQVAAGRAKKRVVGYTGGLMASAAYWIGSAAHELIAAPSAQVGSIGVYTIHADVSRMLENAGIHVTLIKAGAHKAEGHPFGQLSDDDEAAVQARIDDYYDQFVTAVAAHRGVTASAVRAGYGAGRVLNARHAHAAGVVDRVMTFDALLAELQGTTARPAGARATFDFAPAATATSALIPTVTAVAAVVSSPASMARSVPVTDTATAALQAAAADTRERDLRELAKANGKDVAWLDTAITSGQSVSAVQATLLAEYREQARSTPVTTGTGVTVGDTRETKKPWAAFGEFLSAVQAAGVPGAQWDPRLQPLAGTPQGMSQAAPQDGGFLVLPQFSTKLWNGLGSDPNALLPMTDNYTVEGESLTFNAVDETSRATGSRWGGVRGYWLSEADQLTKSKPKFRQVRVEPQEMGVLVYVTDKLLRGSSIALEQFISRAAPEEINFMTGDAIVNGDGVGKPKGFASAASTITVAKETSQAANTVVQENISKMWARLHPRSRANAVWLHNVDVEPALDTLSTVVKNVAGTENVGGYANKVFDSERRTLKGRPLVPCEFCSTLGTVGDLILVDMSGYLTATRGGVDSAMSMHVRFEYLETAFRFTYAVDGQPWLASALTPFKGTNTLSTAVMLATRA